MKLITINCTFSFSGTEQNAINHFNPMQKTLTFENSEFVGTSAEHHSGIFTEKVGIDEGETVQEVLNDYFLVHNPELKGEYFEVKDEEGNEIISIDDWNGEEIIIN